jgi:hypothetical protein
MEFFLLGDAQNKILSLARHGSTNAPPSRHPAMPTLQFEDKPCERLRNRENSACRRNRAAMPHRSIQSFAPACRFIATNAPRELGLVVEAGGQWDYSV